MNYYTPGHKYFRKVAFDFEQLIAKTDFNNTAEREKMHDELNDFTFYIRETGKFERENCHPLLKDKEPFVVAQVEAGYKVVEEKEDVLRNILGPKEGHDKRARFSQENIYNIYLATVDLIDTFRQLLSFKDKVLVPVLQKHNLEKTLRALNLQARSQMSLEQMKENILERIVPCLNFTDKIDVLRDIKEGASEPMFEQVWKLISPEFKPHQRTLIIESLNTEPA